MGTGHLRIGRVACFVALSAALLGGCELATNAAEPAAEAEHRDHDDLAPQCSRSRSTTSDEAL